MQTTAISRADREEKTQKKALADRLKASRQDAQITQEKLAERLRLPRTAITKIEQAERSISTLELAGWAQACGRPIIDFFPKP